MDNKGLRESIEDNNKKNSVESFKNLLAEVTPMVMDEFKLTDEEMKLMKEFTDLSKSDRKKVVAMMQKERKLKKAEKTKANMKKIRSAKKKGLLK